MVRCAGRALPVLIVVAALVGSPTAAQQPRVSIEALQRSVVTLRVLDERGEAFGTGSGVVVSNDGEVLTNYHVIANATYVEVLEPGLKKASMALVKRCDQDADLALLKVPYLRTRNPVHIRSRRIPVGTRLFAIGSPLALEGTVSDGILSAYRETRSATLIQTTAPISPGSSGGGLFTPSGELAGITTMSLTEGQNLNFAIVPPLPLTRLPECGAWGARGAGEPTPTPLVPSVGVREGDLVGPGPDVVEPRLIRLGSFRLPRDARRIAEDGGLRDKGLGTPIIMALVTETGEVAETRVLRPSAYSFVDEAAANALKSGELAPATKHGVRVKMWKAFPITVRP